EEEVEDDVPLHRKKVFGAGLHKKTISFVPASDGTLKSTGGSGVPATKSAQSIADLYMSMVLPGEAAKSKPEAEICVVCKLPLRPSSEPYKQGASMHINSTHETSLAHQICVPHSHPPSALDRSRMGLAVLQSHGWDPDSRKGLGAGQQGIQFPVKARPKDDTTGIGIVVPKSLPPREKKPQLLDAGKVRKQYSEDKKKAATIRRQLFGDDRLEKYLGPGADG
ncbi:hypothetical protein GQ53DRAFT_608505, partial [Thozetella sp. PMI_491]